MLSSNPNSITMKIRAIIYLFLISIVFYNCGEDKKKEEKPSIKLETKTEDNASKSDPNVADLTITGDDMMKYNKNELRAKAGQKVKITLRHIGKLDKQVMGHNVVILNQGVNPEDFAARAATARDTDYIPAGSENEILAHTGLIGGGQTTNVEFVAPSEPGEYEFLCSFPGHFAMMRGKFIVE